MKAVTTYHGWTLRKDDGTIVVILSKDAYGRPQEDTQYVGPFDANNDGEAMAYFSHLTGADATISLGARCYSS